MKNIFRTSSKLIWYYKWSFVSGALVVICVQFIANFAQLYIKVFFDNLDPFNRGFIESAILSYGVLTLVWIILHPVGNILYDNYLIKAARDLKIMVFDKLHELDFDFHAEKRSGSIISLIRRGDQAFWSFNFEIVRGLFPILVDLIFISTVFFSLDQRLGFVILISFFANLLVALAIIKKNIKVREKLNDEEDKISGIIGDNLINYETVNIFAQEHQEQLRLRRQYKYWIDAVWSYANTFRIIELWTGALFLGSIVLIVLIGIEGIENKSLSTGDFAITMTYSFGFFPRLSDLIFRLRELAKHYTDLGKYFDVLAIDVKVKEDPNASNLNVTKGQIDFVEVDFGYTKSDSVLKNISLTIKPKETIAFVGKSGAGKTTLTKLLMRFYDPQKGKILIDGQDISQVTKKSLRSNIGLVPQDASLFNNSLEYNLNYAKPNINKFFTRKAANLAHLATFIDKLPEKYKTVVGERGIKLSGGQRQRLAIARAFIEDAPIIIFDEATSQLDSESEKIIQESFWELAKDKTTIIIAHRLSTIMKADRIVVLDNGEIAEMGTHKELNKIRNGIYKNLWDLQTGTLLE